MTTLFTIGYEGRAQHDVLRLLVDAGVNLLVDVRIRPQSRKPGLSKTALARALGEQGIAYEHRRELGTPLEIRAEFRARNLDVGRAAYRRHLLGDAMDELEWLARAAAVRPTAILCFELQAPECHRRVIAEELMQRHGFEVVDL